MAVLVEVVVPVGMRTPRLAAGMSPKTPDRRDRVKQGQELDDLVPVAAGGGDGERGSVTSTVRWCLEPGRARSTGEGPTRSPFEGPDVRSVHGAVVKVRQGGAAKSGQRGGVQARPDSGLGPVPQPAPGRYPGAARGFCGNIAPRGTGSQHVHDVGEGRPVRNPQPPGAAAAALGGGRQKRGCPLLQAIRNEISSHSGHPADRDHRVQDPSPTHSETISWLANLRVKGCSGCHEESVVTARTRARRTRKGASAPGRARAVVRRGGYGTSAVTVRPGATVTVAQLNVLPFTVLVVAVRGVPSISIRAWSPGKRASQV